MSRGGGDGLGGGRLPRAWAGWHAAAEGCLVGSVALGGGLWPAGQASWPPLGLRLPCAASAELHATPGGSHCLTRCCPSAVAALRPAEDELQLRDELQRQRRGWEEEEEGAGPRTRRRAAERVAASPAVGAVWRGRQLEEEQEEEEVGRKSTRFRGQVPARLAAMLQDEGEEVEDGMQEGGQQLVAPRGGLAMRIPAAAVAAAAAAAGRRPVSAATAPAPAGPAAAPGLPLRLKVKLPPPGSHPTESTAGTGPAAGAASPAPARMVLKLKPGSLRGWPQQQPAQLQQQARQQQQRARQQEQVEDLEEGGDEIIPQVDGAGDDPLQAMYAELFRQAEEGEEEAEAGTQGGVDPCLQDWQLPAAGAEGAAAAAPSLAVPEPEWAPQQGQPGAEAEHGETAAAAAEPAAPPSPPAAAVPPAVTAAILEGPPKHGATTAAEVAGGQAAASGQQTQGPSTSAEQRSPSRRPSPQAARSGPPPSPVLASAPPPGRIPGSPLAPPARPQPHTAPSLVPAAAAAAAAAAPPPAPPPAAAAPPPPDAATRGDQGQLQPPVPRLAPGAAPGGAAAQAVQAQPLSEEEQEGLAALVATLRRWLRAPSALNDVPLAIKQPKVGLGCTHLAARRLGSSSWPMARAGCAWCAPF